MLFTLQYRGYTAKVTNISKDTDITKYISECNISLPKTKNISSIECRFQTDEKVIDNGNEVLIQIFDEVGGLLYSIQGETTLKKRSLPYTYVEKFDYILKDNIDNLYQKTISETMVFYDLYLCNNSDPTNSLLHIVAKNLGFENIDFQDSKFDDDTHIRVPFVYFEEDDRWIDKLQAIIEATNGILYIHNKKLIFRPNNLVFKNILTINSEVLIKNIEESLKGTKYNAIKLSYDNFKKLDNQVVFNLASKVILDENTPKNDGTPTMRITYISSTVADPTLTKATGYYFTSEDPKSKTDITLQEGTHYEMKISQTGCEVKFFNPLPYKLYIDNFEIKGIPLVKYVDNEVLVSTTEDANPMIINKNPLVQTDKQAKFIANRLLAENILSEKEYTFHTKFLHNLKLGELYSLQIEDIDKVVKINSIDISLKPSVFTMLVKADEIKSESIKTTVKSKISANPNTQFIDLKPLEEKIEDNAKDIKEVTQKVQSKLHVGETEPTENVEEHDIWLKESSNTFKIYLNGRWGNVAESDLLPAIKHYNSLRKAELEIGKVNDRAGLFLMNNDEKFGAINGTLAEVSIDKKGTVKMGNVNNLLEWNTKDPARPDKVRSKLYMGVADVSKIPDNVYFKIGDDSNGFSLEFKDGEVGKAKIDGVELGEKLKTDKAEIDKNITNLSKANAELSKEVKTAKSAAVEESKTYINNKKSEIDRNINDLSQADAQLSRDIKSAKDEAKGYADTKKTEAIRDSKSYTDGKKNEIENALKKEITFEVGGEANKYYPVRIYADTSKWCNLRIYRRYNEKAPDSWNTKTHKGGLNLEIGTSLGSNWDGNPNYYIVNKFDETYCSMASKIEQMHIWGCFVWLRGGGAVYHAYTDNHTMNETLKVEVYLNGYDNPPIYKDYPETEKGKAGTYDETGRAESIKALMTYNRSEIDRQFTNADGKLTTLQQKYQNTVQDIESYKTETTANIDTVERALQEGNFTVTGNTVFDGTASFISRGTNERIAISNGSIDFYRTVDGQEQRLTRIKNIRYGTIATDSKGKGIVNFEGFKQPMIVMPSVKSANFGKNMASIFCYVEHIRDTQYRFYVGGTNEHYTEAKPIKMMGKSWTASNAVMSTLHGITGYAEGIGKDVSMNYRQISEAEFRNSYSKRKKNIVTPEFNVTVLSRGQTIFTKSYKMSCDTRTKGYHTDVLIVALQNLNFDMSANNSFKFNSRVNVDYTIKIDITQPYLKVDYYDFSSRGSTGSVYMEIKYSGVIFTLTPAHFKNLSITASAETSTLSDTTGTGEVSFIAMEID